MTGRLTMRDVRRGRQSVNGSPHGSLRYERNEHDWYVEQPADSAKLFMRERFEGAIHDPSCGKGNIVRVARSFGYVATGADIVRRTDLAGVEAPIDFLKDETRRFDNIVCNPPFKIDLAFVLKALELARRKVAMLVKLSFLEGRRKYRALFETNPPTRPYVSIDRISCPPGELDDVIEPEGGMMPYAWLVWERGARPQPLGWI